MAENGQAAPDAFVTRRQALKVGAVVGGALWAVPAVQALNISAAGAATTSGGGGTVPTPTCTGSAYDLKATINLAGLAQPQIGPFVSSNDGTKSCLAVASSDIVALRSQTDCATGGCGATYQTEGASFVIPGPATTVSATALTVSTSAVCGGAHTYSSSAAVVTIGSNTIPVAANADPAPISLAALPVPIPYLTGTVDVIRKVNTPTSSSIDFLYLTYTFAPPLVAPTTGTIIFGHAESFVTNCP